MKLAKSQQYSCIVNYTKKVYFSVRKEVGDVDNVQGHFDRLTLAQFIEFRKNSRVV